MQGRQVDPQSSATGMLMDSNGAATSDVVPKAPLVCPSRGGLLPDGQEDKRGAGAAVFRTLASVCRE